MSFNDELKPKLKICKRINFKVIGLSSSEYFNAYEVIDSQTNRKGILFYNNKRLDITPNLLVTK